MSKIEEGFLGPKRVTKRDGASALLGAGLGLILGGSVFAPEGKKEPVEKAASSADVPDKDVPDAASMKRESQQKPRPSYIEESSREREEEREKEGERKAIFDAIEGSVKGALDEKVKDALRDSEKSEELRAALQEHCMAEIQAMRFEQSGEALIISAPGHKNDPDYIVTFTIISPDEARIVWQEKYDYLQSRQMISQSLEASRPSDEDMRDGVPFILNNDTIFGKSLYSTHDDFSFKIGDGMAFIIFNFCESSAEDAVSKGTQEEGD